MKIFIAISLFLFNSASFSQTELKHFQKSDSLLIERIKAPNPSNYIGKTLNQYLSNELLKKYKVWLPVDEPPGKLYAIILSYSEKVWIQVIFADIQYQRRFSEKRKWSFALLKKEKIYKINYSWEE